MSRLENVQTGDTVTVTGVVSYVGHDTLQINRGDETLVTRRPAIGTTMKITCQGCIGCGGTYKIRCYSFSQVCLSNGEYYNWSQVRVLTPEEAAATESEEKKQKRDAWQKQAMEIPTEILLDVIKERTKAQ